MITLIKNWWWLLTTPKAWVQVYPYSGEVDEVITDIIENEAVVIPTIHVANDKVYWRSAWVNYGDYSIWTGNYPYGYATIGNERPSRFTIKRFKEYIDNYKNIHPEEFI